MEKVDLILNSLKDFFSEVAKGVSDGFATLQESGSGGHAYTAVARWIFILLGLFILLKSIISMLRGKNAYEVWAYFHVNGKHSFPITHWENLVGRSKSADLVVNDPTVSRSQGTLTMDLNGNWHYMDIGGTNTTYLNGKPLGRDKHKMLRMGDELAVGNSRCTLFPISLEEKRNNEAIREAENRIASPWLSLIALTIFQVMTVLQLKIAFGNEYSYKITVSFILLGIITWVYIVAFSLRRKKGFEMEIIAFFLSTLSLAVTASKFNAGVLKQAIAIFLGIALFMFMWNALQDLDRAKKWRKYIIFVAGGLLIFNLVFGKNVFGQANWVVIGGYSIQPSEIVKLAYIWVGAATLDELQEKKNSLRFTIFSGMCFVCLAIMGDFGTALIFFVTFLVISFLRSGDFTKLILLVGIACVGALLLLKFKGYIAHRFSTWGHVWEFPDDAGYQQTRTMSASAAGGLVGVGPGEGWLKHIPASETDLVFGFLTEEWGLIIAVMAVLSIISFTIFAVRSIWTGRSTFYTIAACSAMSLFLFQTMLNVFGSVDIFPLTGVTFPFVSTGGTSMIASWGLLAFLKSADTRGVTYRYEERGDEDDNFIDNDTIHKSYDEGVIGSA